MTEGPLTRAPNRRSRPTAEYVMKQVGGAKHLVHGGASVHFSVFFQGVENVDRQWMQCVRRRVREMATHGMDTNRQAEGVADQQGRK